MAKTSEALRHLSRLEAALAVEPTGRLTTLERVTDEFARRGIGAFDSSAHAGDDFEESDFDAILTDCALPGEVSRTLAEYLTVGYPGHEGVLVVDKSLFQAASARRRSSATPPRAVVHDRGHKRRKQPATSKRGRVKVN